MTESKTEIIRPENIEETIDKKFVGFYFTKLKKINEKLRKKYDVKDVLLTHFNRKIGPILACRQDFSKLTNAYRIEGEKCIDQKDSKEELENLRFCVNLMDFQSTSDKKKKLRLILIDDAKRLVYESIQFGVPSETTPRGKIEDFAVIVIHKKRRFNVREGKGRAIAIEYKRILDKYLEKFRNEESLDKEDMEDIYEFVRKDKKIQLGRTEDTEERIEELIDEYFGIA